MDASLDTNVIIHLYKADFQAILFNRFKNLKVYEFIRYHEMKNHATPEIIDLFDKDVKAGKIELVSDVYLREIGMYNVFQQHVRDIRILFDSGDLGEVFAIAMAKTLGCICLVTDDIKERGPHYTLMRIQDSDVMPFAFYEILFLDYLEERITEEKLLDNFCEICDLSGITMDCSSKLKAFIRRFWSDPYREIEKKWMKSFCVEKNIDAKQKIQKLITYLTTINI
ncbi:MAG: hypothetical protein ACOX2A_00385 [Tepidanaerobacteraceae bacterium]|nr:hypothetical protein [Thermoanaerobacterales bacterium]